MMTRTLTMPKLLLLVVALLATLALASEEKKPKCAKGAHIIAVRGHPPVKSGSKAKPDPDQGYGITLPLLTALKAAIPHSTNQSINYPKDAPVNQENQVAIKNIKKAVQTSVKNCPKTPIILYGYSNGAGIVMNSVCGTTSPLLTGTDPILKKYAKNFIGTFAYSDSTYSPSAPWSKGGCTTPGRFARSDTDACKPFASTIQDYCVKKDDYCCGLGMDHKAHYSYFKKFDKTVAKHAAQKFKAFKKQHA